jgi:hypothetical protein
MMAVQRLAYLLRTTLGDAKAYMPDCTHPPRCLRGSGVSLRNYPKMPINYSVLALAFVFDGTTRLIALRGID